MEVERFDERVRAAFDHRLDLSERDRLDREAAGLSGTQAGGGDQMELAVCVEQPERGSVDGKRGNECRGNLLEGGHEVLARNVGDRLLKSEPPPLALREEMPGADLVGEVDGERDHDPAPAVGVDPVEAGAPPAGASPEEVVAELGHVTRPPGRGHLLQE